MIHFVFIPNDNLFFAFSLSLCWLCFFCVGFVFHLFSFMLIFLLLVEMDWNDWPFSISDPINLPISNILTISFFIYNTRAHTSSIDPFNSMAIVEVHFEFARIYKREIYSNFIQWHVCEFVLTFVFSVSIFFLLVSMWKKQYHRNLRKY